MRANRHLTRFVTLAAVIVLTLSFAIGPVAGQEPAPNAPDQDHSVYLPMTRNLPGSIYGIVRDGGSLASNVILELHRLDVNTFNDTLVDTTMSDSSGNYAFIDEPSLPLDQIYYVKYLNPGDTTTLWRWYTRPLQTYTADTIVHIGDFDLANVTLSSPAFGANVNLPEIFTWVRRPATPSDNYEFDLYEDCDHCALFYTVPPLGYVGSYNLTTLPPGFDYDIWYFWEIWVYAPDGGYGISYAANAVMFSNKSLNAVPLKELLEAQRERIATEKLLRNLQARR